MAIRFFDMFAGIGGFRSGLEAVGGFECIGHCEIDKKANQAYNAIYQPKGEIYFEDATKIDTNDLPDIDLICAGFPCQSFSVAGKRLGFRDDTRGTLFFEVARIAEAKRPPLFLLENVPGLLSHDGGRTLFTIFSTLVELGYYRLDSPTIDELNFFANRIAQMDDSELAIFRIQHHLEYDAPMVLRNHLRRRCRLLHDDGQ